MSYTLHNGDALTVLRTLPECCVHCCVTSPPYWRMRDYQCEGQLGLEPTIEQYIANQVEVFRQVRRVLRSDGTLWVNMGDRYSTGGRGGYAGDLAPRALRYSRKHGVIGSQTGPPPGFKDKDLLGLPWRLALALQADGWWLRCDCIWHKPNAKPESAKDRPGGSHEYVFLFAKRESYYYDWWAHHTFNPWEGCVKVSPECDNCYAAERDHRFHDGKHWGHDAARLVHVERYWDQLDQWNVDAYYADEQARVFCGSLCDIMEDRRDLDPLRERLWDKVEETPWLDYLLTTKRPQNFRRLLPSKWLAGMPSNVWGITTVGLPGSAWRIWQLTKIPFPVRGIIAEPLLASLAEVDLTGIDWVITGGESGSQARPTNPDWFRELRDRCVAEKRSFFFKQWGQYEALTRIDGIHESPFGGHLVTKLKKKNTSRLLDGAEWSQVPPADTSPVRDFNRGTKVVTV